MATCSVPDCRAVAVLQWQRAATSEEHQQAERAIQSQQSRIVQYQRGQAMLNAVELRDRLDRIQARADAGDLDAKKILPLARQQAVDAQAAHDRIADAPHVVMAGPCTVAVFGCDTHAVDLESATELHQPGCLTEGTCSCETTSLISEGDGNV